MKNFFFFLRHFGAFLVSLILEILIRVPRTQSWSIGLIDKWSDGNAYAGYRYETAWNLQGTYAKVTNGEPCDYCGWTVEKNKHHEYCEMMLKVKHMSESELLATWKGLKHYDPAGFYDQSANITMDEWAETVYSEISQRELEWAAYEAQLDPPVQWEEVDEKDDEDLICPCGHRSFAHYMHESHCEVPHCSCPEFGTPVEEYEEFQRVWYTESPGGHNYYE